MSKNPQSVNYKPNPEGEGSDNAEGRAKTVANATKASVGYSEAKELQKAKDAMARSQT